MQFARSDDETQEETSNMVLFIGGGVGKNVHLYNQLKLSLDKLLLRKSKVK